MLGSCTESVAEAVFETVMVEGEDIGLEVCMVEIQRQGKTPSERAQTRFGVDGDGGCARTYFSGRKPWQKREHVAFRAERPLGYMFSSAAPTRPAGRCVSSTLRRQHAIVTLQPPVLTLPLK